MDRVDISGLDIDYINKFVGHDAQILQESNGRRQFVVEKFPLGRGGMAAIYRAYDLENQKEVALKIPFIKTRKIEPEDENEPIIASFDPGINNQDENEHKKYDGGYQKMVKKLNGDTLIVNPPNKVAAAEIRERFIRTATALREGEFQQRIHHPNILEAEGVTWATPPGVSLKEYPPIPIVILKLLDPKDWDAMDRKLYYEKKFDLSTAYHYFSQIAKGVDFLAYSNPPIYHRDLKLGNFLINAKNNNVKIIDFNFSSGAYKVPANVAAGTPAYLSPEVARKGGVPDLRSETFSLAINLFECITGVLPFNADTPEQAIENIALIKYDLSPLDSNDPETRARLKIFFKKAFAEEKKDRFQSAMEMMKEFKKIAQD